VYFGYHLMLDCSGCVGIDNKENIYNFIKDLVPRIDMQAHGEPIIEHLLRGDRRRRPRTDCNGYACSWHP